MGARLDADTCAGVDDYSYAVGETALGLGGSFVVSCADPQAAQAANVYSAARGQAVGAGADNNDNGYLAVEGNDAEEGITF